MLRELTEYKKCVSITEDQSSRGQVFIPWSSKHAENKWNIPVWVFQLYPSPDGEIWSIFTPRYCDSNIGNFDSWCSCKYFCLISVLLIVVIWNRSSYCRSWSKSHQTIEDSVDEKDVFWVSNPVSDYVYGLRKWSKIRNTSSMSEWMNPKYKRIGHLIHRIQFVSSGHLLINEYLWDQTKLNCLRVTVETDEETSPTRSLVTHTSSLKNITHEIFSLICVSLSDKKLKHDRVLIILRSSSAWLGHVLLNSLSIISGQICVKDLCVDASESYASRWMGQLPRVIVSNNGIVQIIDTNTWKWACFEWSLSNVLSSRFLRGWSSSSFNTYRYAIDYLFSLLLLPKSMCLFLSWS